MGKAKKGKKLDYEDDADDHIETEKTADDDVSTKTKKKEKKGRESSVVESDSEGETGKKKRKNKDIESTTDGLKDLSISNKSKKDKKKGKAASSDDDSEAATITKSKKKGKSGGGDDSEGEAVSGAGGRGGFAALALSDDDEPQPSAAPASDDEPEKPQPNKPEKKGGKKSKKKKKDEEDEDLDQILAELEMEYSGNAPQVKADPPEEAVEAEAPEQESKKSKKKEKKKEEEKKEDKEDEERPEGEEDEDGKSVKTAAQKRKEKKEREKLKRQTEAKTVKVKESSVEPVAEERIDEATPELEDKLDDAEAPDDDDDKKKKKKKKGAKEEKEKKGMPNKKVVAAMQEALKKIKEEEERMQKEEEERLKKEEEAEKLRQEQMRLEQERKDKKKAKEKERKERLKAEGKLLTAKQKADKARVEAMLSAMKAKYGAAAVIPGSKPTSAKSQQKKKKDEQSLAKGEGEGKGDADSSRKVSETESTPPPADQVKDSWEDVENIKDAWDADSADENNEEDKPEEEQSTAKVIDEKKTVVQVKDRNGAEQDKAHSEDESSNESDDESQSSDSDDSEERHAKKTDAEKKREKAVARIKARQEKAEKNMTLDELRAAVVCVLGHVDTGKTKILDKLRRTNVQDGEAGGITQQIGATNVPIDAIKEQTRHVKGFSQVELRIPGLLIIDTPGHESFSNLRSRGSSLCDIAILVVDIMHGLEPQTIESLNLLKQRKTPFIVALNKIDRLYDWQTMNRKDIRDIIKSQASNTQLEFEQRAKEVIVQFAEQGMNAALFYENQDPRSYVSLVPTSAITGEGMGNLLALIIESCQTHLAKRLMFSEELQATVLEVKAIPGLGTTIDVILVNGYLRETDTVVLAGTEAPIVTQIRSLLMPQPLKELRVKNAYVEFKEVKAAQGVKIAAKDLEKVIAGLNLRVAHKPDEVEILREEAGRELRSALSSIKLQERGVYVQASTLGSLEALLEFLKTSSIPYANIRIGPVVKKDVMKASTMLEHDSQFATILAFDVKIERDAQELADSLGVRIFQADIIYHLFDKFMSYREELKKKKREEFKSIAVFPCKLRILPQFVFNSRDPIVMGVIVEAGIVKEGTPICVPTKEFVEVGIVTSIEVNHKTQETARKGQEVCIKIDAIPGEAPKMFGRHFDEKDLLVSKISRQSIDACKDYFREDLVKTDWQLMVELKKLFQIL